jgi:hypothetical protein
MEIVRFSGGELNGLVVEAPHELAAQLPFMKLALTAAGQLLDIDEQRRIRDARVLRRPGEHTPEPAPAAPPAPAPTPTTSTPAAEPRPPQPAPAPAPAQRPPVALAPVFLAARPAQ